MGKVGRDRESGSGMRSFLGMGKPAWPTGTEVYLHTGFSTIFRWNDRQMDRQADGQYWDGPAWAIIHRNSEDFLWVSLLQLISCLALTPPDLHLFLPPSPARLSPWTPSFSWCTLHHCDEEWKVKGTPSLTLLRQPRKDSIWGWEGDKRLSSGSYQRKTATGVGAFFFFNLNKNN